MLKGLALASKPELECQETSRLPLGFHFPTVPSRQRYNLPRIDRSNDAVVVPRRPRDMCVMTSRESGCTPGLPLGSTVELLGVEADTEIEREGKSCRRHGENPRDTEYRLDATVDRVIKYTRRGSRGRNARLVGD